MNTFDPLLQASPQPERHETPVANRRFTHPSGTRLLDRFVVQRGLGIGGFGEVYFAISDAGKEVAIKQIQRNLDIELRGVSQCLNLKHPNLVTLYDVCQDDIGQWYVVMEYVAGANLREQLDEHAKGFSDSEIRRWFDGLAAGVAHMHDEGLVHRDLKPGNLFDDRGVIKVGDCGLSKFISETRRGGQTESVGTFHYMAPEVGRGEYGREIDVYALGVILYELVTGRLPFDGETSHEIIIKHMTAKPDLTGVRQPYAAVIARALEKDPAARWRNVSEMAAAVAGAATRTLPIDATVLTATMVASPSPQMPVVNPKQEPVARAVASSISDIRSWWAGIHLTWFPKAVLLGLIVVGLIINTRWLLPLLSVLGIVYVPYYLIRQMLIGPSPGVSYQEARMHSLARQNRYKPISKKRWMQFKRIELASKRASVQLAELAGSWTAATIATILMMVAAYLVTARGETTTAHAIAPLGWTAAMVLATSMSILALGKLWEGRDGDPIRRRMAMLGIGGGLGALAYAIATFLLLDPSAGITRWMHRPVLSSALYDPGAMPRLGAYMVHFALLMSVLRWWRTTDPLRSSRLSAWAIVLAALVDFAIQRLVPIAQPAGMMIAAGSVIAIQIGAPWENSNQRTEWDRSATPAPAQVGRGTP